MEPKSSKSLPRTSKKKPMSQKWRHLGNRRHLRTQKRPQRGPMERPNAAPEAAWRRKGSKHGETKPEERSEAPYEPQMICREAKMKPTPAWRSLRYECCAS